MNKNIVSIKGTPYGLVFYFDTTQAGFGQVCAALEEKLLHSGKNRKEQLWFIFLAAAVFRREPFCEPNSRNHPAAALVQSIRRGRKTTARTGKGAVFPSHPTGIPLH